MSVRYKCDECGAERIGNGSMVIVTIEIEPSQVEPRGRELHFCNEDNKHCYDEWAVRSMSKREQRREGYWIEDTPR